MAALFPQLPPKRPHKPPRNAFCRWLAPQNIKPKKWEEHIKISDQRLEEARFHTVWVVCLTVLTRGKPALFLFGKFVCLLRPDIFVCISGSFTEFQTVLMLIGYARISTGDQNLFLQQDAIRAAGCERVFECKGRNWAQEVKFEFSSIGNDRREFIAWLLGQCLEDGVEPPSVFEDAAQEYLADRLSTPLQFAEHLNRAFTDAYRMGADQVTRDIVSETISVGFDDLDARLARIGYTPKALADLADTRLPEMRRFLKGQLDPDRTDELSTLMRKAGLPI